MAAHYSANNAKEEEKSLGFGVREWIKENKLKTVGGLWAATLAASLAYNCARPSMKPSLRLIHARMHAQAITLVGICGAGLVNSFENTKQYADDLHSHSSNNKSQSYLNKYTDDIVLLVDMFE